MKFLIFGDVSGVLGREGLDRALPLLRKEFEPDSVIINIENIAHGKGVTAETMRQALAWKADVYTTGDHAWDHEQAISILNDPAVPMIRPANYPKKAAGRGWHVFQNGAFRVAVINLQGQVMFRNHPANPFEALDEILAIPEVAGANITLLDFHAEATSEKRGLGFYADGRLSAMWGTHTHVPTADAQILPNGTGYITDLGMCGGYNSIIGMSPEGPLKMFTQQTKAKFEPPTEGPAEVNGIFLEVDPSTGKTNRIEHIRRIVDNKGDVK